MRGRALTEEILQTKHTLRTLAALAAAGLALTACGSTDSSSSTATDSGSCTAGQKLAFLGATTGDYGALGQNMVGGIKLALSEYNDKHSDCQVTLKTYDSQGDPDKATPLATQIVQDDSIVGLVGPGFSGESLSTGKTFNAAGLPSVSPSATNVTITQQGWATWHRVIGNDSAQGAAAATYITDTAKASKVFVIDDGSDYGKGLASYVHDGLGSKVTGTDTVQTGQTDFSATVTAPASLASSMQNWAVRCRFSTLWPLYVPTGLPSTKTSNSIGSLPAATALLTDSPAALVSTRPMMSSKLSGSVFLPAPICEIFLGADFLIATSGGRSSGMYRIRRQFGQNTRSSRECSLL